ncbi:FecCD family ABC transporter permease [Thermogladius sp. 4427co]|uniref:FecCD family ABC transporter permease n=1 Tax=Thermogladius sp. 4427co TaxID=3450718 RepID=UPI003F7B20A9
MKNILGNRDIFFYFETLLLNIVILSFFAYVVYTIDFKNIENRVLFEYRFYRDTYAFLAGFILGYSGSILQTVLRNPLVDHYILGVGSASLFATYLAIALTNSVNYTQTILASLVGGLTGLCLTVSIAKYLGGREVSYVLAGVGVTSLFSGLSFILSYFIIQKFPYAYSLLMGSFTTPLKEYMSVLIVLLIVASASYLYLAKKLNVLLLGDIFAKQLGVDPYKLRLLGSIIGGGLASIIVGFFGTIGFIGLATPNLSRALLRTGDNRLVLLTSSIIAGVLLLSADLFSRKILVASVGEVPAGAIVSAIGGGFFLGVLAKRARGFK